MRFDDLTTKQKQKINDFNSQLKALVEEQNELSEVKLVAKTKRFLEKVREEHKL